METKSTNTQTETQTNTNIVMDTNIGVFGSSDNYSMACKASTTLAQSTLIPQHYRNNPANVLVAFEMATRLKMSPFDVMQNMYLVQGRPSWSSSFLIGRINASGKYDHELRFDETKSKDGKPYSCIAWTRRKGERIEGIEITMDMAKAEGWLGKNGSKWQTIPQVMLRYRAASFFARMNCPEITMGLYTSEEVQDNEFDTYNNDLFVDKVQEDVQANANSVEVVLDAEVVEE